ncbi:MAG: preprotein translocase subunit SecE [Deltaproteobacteria bacterium]|nr:preprotein translocase subunit SecE [Deltaproteobacteria bacterium]
MTPKRWTFLSYGVASVLSFFVFRQILGTVWDYFRWPLFEEWVVQFPDLASLGLAGAAFVILKRNRQAGDFMGEVVAELGKVTWPLKKETLVSAVIVVVMVGIAAVILSIFDTVWGTSTQRLLAF